MEAAKLYDPSIADLYAEYTDNKPGCKGAKEFVDSVKPHLIGLNLWLEKIASGDFDKKLEKVSTLENKREHQLMDTFAHVLTVYSTDPDTQRKGMHVTSDLSSRLGTPPRDEQFAAVWGGHTAQQIREAFPAAGRSVA